MKNIKRIIFWIVFSLLICFLVYLYTNWVIIVREDITDINLVIYISLFVIFLYYLIFYAVRPTYIKYYRVINTIIWIVVIYISQYFLANSWIDGIYYWDILCLIWVVLTIIWPTKLLVTKELEDSKKVEIIEA
jgi:hypothetical protein